jgi:hypothetical protein
MSSVADTSRNAAPAGTGSGVERNKKKISNMKDLLPLLERILELDLLGYIPTSSCWSLCREDRDWT